MTDSCVSSLDQSEGKHEHVTIRKDKQKMNSNKDLDDKSSHHSGTSYASSASTRAAAKAAALKVKLKYIDLETKSKAEYEKVKTKKEIDMLEATMEALKSEGSGVLGIEDGKDDYVAGYIANHQVANPKVSTGSFYELYDDHPPDNSHIPVELNPMTHSTPISSHVGMNPLASSYEPVSSKHVQFTQPVAVVNSESAYKDHNSYAEEGLVEIAKTLANQINISRLPSPEPGVFNGDPLTYPSWKAGFETLIEQRDIPLHERIHYLKKYLGKSVREVIENFFLLNTDVAYDSAKNLLDERYGNPFIIGSAFREKLDSWPKIPNRDGIALQKLSDFLMQCRAAQESMGLLLVLDDEFENQKILSKLPDWLISRWGRIIYNWKVDPGRECFPPFKVFVDFLVTEAKIACDPITSQLQSRNMSSAHHAPSTKSYKPNHTRTLKTEVKEKGPSVLKVVKHVVCALCKGAHHLDVCRSFLSKSLEERQAFIKESSICFGCLNDGHMSRNCKQRLKCKTCSRLHPTSLHIDTSTKGVDVVKGTMTESHTAASAQNASKLSCSSMIVPVYLSHIDEPDKEVLIYAMLDTQSDTTFVLNETCKNLDVSGPNVHLLLSTMHAQNSVVGSSKIKGLVVRGYNSTEKISLPVAYSRDIMPANRSHIPSPEMVEKWPYLYPIVAELMPISDCAVGLLVGYNCTKALAPREVIPPVENGPFGVRTDLGWSIVGIVDTVVDDSDSIGSSHSVVTCKDPYEKTSVKLSDTSKQVVFSFRSSVREIIDPLDISRMMELDFVEKCDGIGLSQNDQKFLEIMTSGIHTADGHYEMPLPFLKRPILPDNKGIALKRLTQLGKRFQSNPEYKASYMEFINKLIDSGYAEGVGDSEKEGQIWYIPHHGVYHPKKPGKLRVVFDCSARYNDVALNDFLLQGPDLTNSIVGVLCRFRMEPIAFMCDIEQMFHQFKVDCNDRNYLRFLWWEDPNKLETPITYRMTVHLFGAASSPGCANFALKQCANDYEEEFGIETANFIRQDFYVDDGLKSLPCVSDAVEVLSKSIEMCKRKGLRLHKIISNSKEVLNTVSSEDRSKSLDDIDLLVDDLPIERALGVQWCVESDTFQFRIVLCDRPLTRRGILSTINSVYDPLGFISPVILVGKQILQQMCQDNSDWDSSLPEDLHVRWDRWRKNLHLLESVRVNRCVQPEGFGEVDVTELHHFSDASTLGYGQCTYLRIVNKFQRVHCSLLMGKSRVAPMKSVTIPRLELTAATVSTRISSMLKGELGYSDVVEWFWTDSSVVLGYIANDSRRFHVFVANRVQQIREKSDPSQWHYIATKENPADIASRGASPDELVESNWFNGPNMLWKPELPVESSNHSLKIDDPEIKKSQSLKTTASFPSCSMLERFEYFSSWNKVKRAVALCLRFKQLLFKRSVEKLGGAKPKGDSKCVVETLPMELLHDAEIEIIKLVQANSFNSEIEVLQNTGSKRGIIFKSSPLYKLNPFLDDSGVLRVGGRIRNAGLDFNVTHPIVLPKQGHITGLIARHFHEAVHHQGRGFTTNELRSYGFWIIGCSRVIRTLISKCVVCRRLRGTLQNQIMSDLPTDRLEPAPPFTYSAVDYFGPWLIKEGRKELKRYGVLFTCLLCRAVHLEVANSLDTSSFINAVRRFVSFRGPVRQLRSDRGTNFVGAERELKEAVSELDESEISQFLLKRGCDFIVFKMNVPSASHMGGVWERQIRSVRSILATLLHQSGTQLDDESLRTFMCEVAAVINGRPLTVDNLNDPVSLEPLTPNHLLTMKSKIILPPPGKFMKTDMYSRKRWRRIQYLANVFWSRWRQEFLQNLQVRNKWNAPKRDLAIGDVVLIKDEHQPRNMWSLARIVEVYPDDDSHIRKVRLMVGDPCLDNKGKRTNPISYLERPIHKLVLLNEAV